MSAPSFDSELSVVIHSPPYPHPQLSLIMKEENGPGESSNTTMPKHKIQKVPKLLRLMGTESTKKCYVPQLVSIGPYHHKDENLKSFEKFKFQYTIEYVKSCGPSHSTNDLYNKVADVAIEARNCYAEDTNIDVTDFTLMMFVDGCFILQYIRYMTNKEDQAKMKMKSHEEAFVRRDLFLLENQLPFIVLNALMSMNLDFEEGLELIKKFINNTMARPTEDSLVEKVENFITNHVTDRKRETLGQPKSQEPAHLLDLLHRQLINPKAFEVSKDKGREGNGWYSYRSVQELKAAGIQCRPNKKSNFFTDARYEPQFIRAILRLPPMTIDDSTQALLLNLVAYEMCPDIPNDLGVTSYLWFMDTLIDQAEDVKELRKKGIILNFLGSDQHVADLFNEIAQNLVPNSDAYKDVKKRIERHYKSNVKLWMTEWLHTHFSSPWTSLAFLAALLAIALSFVQTYYAVNPKK